MVGCMQTVANHSAPSLTEVICQRYLETVTLPITNYKIQKNYFIDSFQILPLFWALKVVSENQCAFYCKLTRGTVDLSPLKLLFTKCCNFISVKVMITHYRTNEDTFPQLLQTIIRGLLFP